MPSVDTVVQNTWNQLRAMTSADRMSVITALQHLHEQETMDFEESVHPHSEQEHRQKDDAEDQGESHCPQQGQITDDGSGDCVTVECQMALGQDCRQVETGEEHQPSILLHHPVENVQLDQLGLEHFVGKKSMIFVSCYLCITANGIFSVRYTVNTVKISRNKTKCHFFVKF